MAENKLWSAAVKWMVVQLSTVVSLNTNRLCYIMIDDSLTQTIDKMNFVSRESRFLTEFVYLDCLSCN